MCAHMILDWLSYVHPFGAFGLTPWNPSTGLGFAMVLLMGKRTLPLFFAAVIVSNVLIRGMPVPMWVAIAESLLVGAGYGLALTALLHPALRFDTSLAAVRDLFLLLLALFLSGAAVAFSYVSVLVTADLLPAQDAPVALLRYWVGDMIGVAVVTPFCLLLISRQPLMPFEWETITQIASTIALTLWVATVFAQHHQLQLFYLLFLPTTWVAVRSGVEGVSVALMSIQLGLVLSLVMFGGGGVDVLDFQARMLVLAITGLVAGVLVSERRAAEMRLRVNQAALAQVSRLGSMGELAAAIAHEINQPLSAAGTYTRLVAESLEGETLRDQGTREVAAKAASQIGRAADVVRRLRTLVRLGRSERAPTSVATIIHEAVDQARRDLDNQEITLRLALENELPLLMADRLQIEQVLLNLIRNAAEAIGEQRNGTREITVQARRTGPDVVELSVVDTGGGFAATLAGAVPVPLSTTKPDGLGIGLSLCRSIAEAHGGTLVIRNTGSGACVSISLPIAEA
jgi:two-component system, LuxR family, sensor kinase FixL